MIGRMMWRLGGARRSKSNARAAYRMGEEGRRACQIVFCTRLECKLQKEKDEEDEERDFINQ